MRASNFRKTDTRLSADIDGFELFFDFPAEFAPAVPGDVFLCAALLVAMKAGQPLTIDAPCSPALLANCRGELQEIFCSWYPDLRRIEVHAEEARPAAGRHGVGSFFSGGVDGSYTFLRHREEITHLVSVQGIDVQVDGDALWGRIIDANQAFADAHGKALVNVRSNIRRFCHPRGVGWSVLNGAGLAAIAHALGLARFYIAASHTYAELFPWGSHPLTDHAWGSNSVQLIHDGAARRSEKLRLIGTSPEALNMLRVCWQDAGYNCGQCDKCIRTRTTLRLLGLSTPTLQPLADPKELSKLKIWEESEESFVADNLQLAEQVGDQPIAQRLRSALRSYRMRRSLGSFDRDVLGGLVHRVKSVFRR